MAMMQPKNKELTVKQYEFYKRKGLADEKIMKMHGYHTASLNAWKKENNLIGVKFETDLKVTEGKLLREKEVSALSVEGKSNKQPQISSVPDRTAHETNANKPTPTKESSEQEVALKANIEVSETVELEPSVKYVEELEEQHCKDTETIGQLEEEADSLKKRLKGALTRCDENRSETLHEQNKRHEEAKEADERYEALVLETNRRMERLEVQYDIEISNLKNQLKLQDKALEKHAEDEQLIGMLLRKAGSYAERFAE